MILIIGGAYQNKLSFTMNITGLAEGQFADGRSCSEEELLHAKGVTYLNDYIRRQVERGGDVSALADRIEKESPGIVIICDEVGCGVVPVDQSERKWREAVGRVCVQLASKSEEVYRVICGIGVKLKG